MDEHSNWAGDDGRFLADTAERTIKSWLRHSEFLARCFDKQNPLDSQLAYVIFPIEKTVQAKFIYVGELQPMPSTDSDFSTQ